MNEHNRSPFALTNWAKLLKGKRPAPTARLRLEQLEDRLVPSGTPLPTLDLTTPGAIGEINGAIFHQTNTQPTGTGVINSFVRLQAANGKATVEQGYNTGARPLQFDENKSPQFTRNLQLNELPLVNIGGTKYRTFLLDINQKSSQPLLSLDDVRVYVSNAPNLSGYDAVAHTLGGATLVYDLDASGDNWVKLDARLNHGSGSGDMLMYVPDAAFGGNTYVYLYSRFGLNLAGNSGFEEWAPGQASATPAGGSISGGVNNSQNVGLQNVMVFLDTNGNGVLDNNEVWTFTDANGNYSFTNLATGLGTFSTYQVGIVAQDDWTVTMPAQTTFNLSSPNQTVTGVNFVVSVNSSSDGTGGSDQTGLT